MTSPIRGMKNSNYNYQSNTSQNYEEEFWKLKAQKAETSIQELKKQNHILNKRLIQMSRIEQQLREKIIDYEDDWKNRSRKLATQRNTQRYSKAQNEDKQVQVAQIQRLYKEIRIIKNVHELQLSKLQEENKKLKKQVSDGAKIQTNQKETLEHQKATTKLQEELSLLKRRLTHTEQNLGRVKEQKGKLLLDNQELKKLIQDIKMKEKIALKEQEQKFYDYKKYFEELNDLRMSNKIQSQYQGTEIPAFQFQPSFAHKNQQLYEETLKEQAKNNLEAEVQKLKKELSAKEKQEKELQQKIRLERSDFQNQKLASEIKRKKAEGDLVEVKSQLQNVLRKLAPLLQNNRQLKHSKENVDTRISLSILEVFLKRYKIQAF